MRMTAFILLFYFLLYLLHPFSGTGYMMGFVFATVLGFMAEGLASVTMELWRISTRE